MGIWKRRTGSSRTARSVDRANRRARQFTVGLGMLILIPCLFFSWSAIETTRGIRVRNALERNETTAALTARLLDVQSDAALSVRLSRTEQWLNGIAGEEAVSIYIVNRSGGILAHSAQASARPEGFSQSQILKEVAVRKTGNVSEDSSKTGDPILAGYALAEVPKWVVVVTQPRSAALSSTNFLAARLSLTSVPALIFMLLAAKVVANLYRRQEAAARQLEAQNLKLRKADEAKSDFLANVSHDLWTPLAGIQLSISSLLDSNIDWSLKQARDHLQLASVGLSQISNRVRNLLEMARLETSSDQASKEPCDLWDLLSSAIERMEPLLRGRKICADFPDYPLMFHGRYSQMEMVLMNILENAVKYSPPGAPIIMTGSMKGDYVYFSLRDHGPGVEMQDAAHIFEKFYRAQPLHHMGGTGLGLAICKSIVEGHGGLIGVMNAPEGGAIFWFTIPELGAGEEPRL
jgi:signal transduction histidine kinase